MNYSLLKQILGYLQSFEGLPHESEEATLGSFVDYLNHKVKEEERVAEVTEEESLNVTIAQYVAHLYRFAKGYSKIALENSPLTTVDDYLYLGDVLRMKHCTKTELIEHNSHEKTSGMEIIKRLLKNGFVEQQDDPNDGRSKQLSITEAGKKEFFATLEAMQKSANLIGGPLSVVEKLQLTQLLQKLHEFHKPLFTDKNASLDEMLELLDSEQQAQ